MNPGKAEGWLTVAQASRLLGVNPKTLRRWADAGRVPALITTGGHRRFARSDIDRLGRRRPDQQRLRLEAVSRLIADAARREPDTIQGGELPLAQPDGDDEQLLDAGRGLIAEALAQIERGHRLSPQLVDRVLAATGDYGRSLAALRVPQMDVIRSYADFQAAFMEEAAAVLRWRGPGGSDPLDLLVDVHRLMLRVLVTLLEAYHGHLVPAEE